MSTGIAGSFRSCVEAIGWTYEVVRHPDGRSLHGLKGSGSLIRDMFLIHRDETVTVRAGLRLPLLQSAAYLLFDTTEWTGNSVDAKTYKCFEPEPVSVDSLTDEVMMVMVREVAAQLEGLREPGAIAPFLAYKHMRKRIHWNGVRWHWIALNFLGHGPEAAQKEIKAETRWINRITPSNLLAMAITKILAPKSLARDLASLRQAEQRIATISLPAYEKFSYTFSVDRVDRE